MTTILVWNCADDLTHASDEVAGIESLRSDDCDVVTAGRSIEWDRLASFAGAVKPTIFHFIGHGDSGGQIYVCESGKHLGRPAIDVIRLVRAASPSLEGVFLSGCFTTKPGPELLDALPTAAGWAIGAVAEVDDDLAAALSKKFYEYLLATSSPAEEAYRVATAYARADWGDEVPHTAWFVRSPLPAVDQMARTISASLRTVFDRSAFKTRMRDEVSMRELDDALQDVGHALGTGQVRSRQHRTVIEPASFPAAWLQDPEIQRFVSKATRGIADTRRALAVVRQGAQGMDYVVGNALNFDSVRSPDEWMRAVNEVDRSRNRILSAANDLFERNDVPTLPEIPTSFARSDVESARRRSRGA